MPQNLKTLIMILAVLSLSTIASPGISQENGKKDGKTETAATLAANPEDIASIEAIIGALYDVISGPARPRNWDRMRSLLVPGARFIVRNAKAENGLRVLTLEQYIASSGSYFLKNGFFETGIHNEIVHYDSIAHVFSTYESRHGEGEEPFARGINSIQLLHHNDRWWVVSVYWQQESEDTPIPTEFLPSGQ